VDPIIINTFVTIWPDQKNSPVTGQSAAIASKCRENPKVLSQILPLLIFNTKRDVLADSLVTLVKS